jgi:hypothetical protein
LTYPEAAWHRQQHVVSFVFQPGFSIRSLAGLPKPSQHSYSPARGSPAAPIKANHPAVHSLISDANCSGSHAKTTSQVEELACVQP